MRRTFYYGKTKETGTSSTNDRRKTKSLSSGLLQEYDIQSADDIQEALKDLLSGTIQDMLETEMDNHLGYDRYERSGEPNYRNGTKSKTVRSKYGRIRGRCATGSPEFL